jgi:membrane-anchored protein YejM (alkaline phosphatase superfamily)
MPGSVTHSDITVDVAATHPALAVESTRYESDSGQNTGFFVANYALLVFICASYLASVKMQDAQTLLFGTAVLLTYPLLYLLPSVSVSCITGRIKAMTTHAGRGVYLRAALIVVLSSVTIIMVLLDSRVYQLYGFHINGFVINLVVTPGGIESLGGDLRSTATVIAGIMFILLMETAFYFGLKKRRLLRRRTVKVVLIVLSFASLGERVSYGIADVTLHAGTLNLSQTFPLYSELRIRSFARHLGIERPKRESFSLASSDAQLHYPAHPMLVKAGHARPNIIWLVAESLRRDMLTPEIMPATYAFANRSLHFLKHYSGGNGTRQGLFSLFYGLHGSYWDSFLNNNTGPVLIDQLLKDDYSFGMYTGATFSYPEFDRTIFARLPAEYLHQFDDDTISPEIRDRLNVASLISQLQNRDPARPFAGMVFFESTHARYFFEKEAKIRTPVLEHLNYVTMDRDSLRSEIVELKNRYINAARQVDNQIRRLVTHLDTEDLLRDTIVVITGDHGEEFMEHGHWGHNNGFSEEQIGVPFVLHLPNQAPRRIRRTTSHTDLVATLMPQLGVTNPPADYTVGHSLLEPEKHKFIVIAGTTGICYVDDKFKFTIPNKSDATVSNQLTTSIDQPAANVLQFIRSRKIDVALALQETRLFGN